MSEQTQYKLEYKLLYSLVVAGKSAKFAEAAIQRFFEGDPKWEANIWYAGATPFKYVEWCIHHQVLLQALKLARTGNYTKLERAFKAIVEANLDLRVCTPQDLEKIPGIGPKTSRFFILWTRPGAEFAALDTHILKWMRYLGYKAPKSTPTGQLYSQLETGFLSEAARRRVGRRKMTPGELDEKIWRWCQENNNKGLDYSQASSWPKELQ